MSNIFTVDTTQLPVTSVCVYQADRAEVHRIVPVELEEGQNHIVVERLPTGIETDSIRVEGTGNAVIFDVIHNPTFRQSSATKVANNPELRDIQKQKDDLKAEKEILEQQSKMLADYSSTLRANVADGAKLAQFLSLYKDKKTQISEELEGVKAKIQQLGELSKTKFDDEVKADSADQTRQTKVTVVVLAEKKGNAELSIRYMVNGASWTPIYDLRANITQEAGKSSNITLNYKASISQKTGEDWTDVALTLSTAAPQLGAEIPTLSPYKIGRPRPPPPPPMMYMSAPLAMSRSAHFVDEYDPTIEDADYAEESGLAFSAPPPPPIAHATATAIEGATSSTFVISGKSSIPSHHQGDEQTHKVSVAVIDLDSKLEWVTVPKVQTAAFLKCKVKNTSKYILLPGQSNVFMDGNFVCKSTLPSVSPNESFSTSLGVDPSIRITYHPQQKKTKNASGGLLSNKIDVTSYVQRLTIKNTRSTAASPLFVKDQIPVSEDSDLKVLLTEPRITKERQEIPISNAIKAHWAPRDSDREDENDKANAGTEEDGVIEWICDVPAGKTYELSLAWEVSGPAGKQWVRQY